MRVEQEKELPIGDKLFKVKKFDPETGCYWAFKFMGNMSHLKKSEMAGKINDFIEMDRKQFKELQKDCLSHSLIKMESGWHSVMNSEGFLTVPDLTGPEALQLTVFAFLFSLADFFDKTLLENLSTAAVGIFQTIGTDNSH